MEATKITLRVAAIDDAATIAKVVALAIGDEAALRAYCGDDYLTLLTEIARRERTQYSWQNSIIAECNGEIAGAVIGYDGGALEELRCGTLKTIDEFLGSSPSIADETEKEEYYLDSIAVFSKFRGLGIGSALVEAFCRRAFEQGHKCVGLIVDCENPKAEELYTALGFKRVKTKIFFGHQMWHLQRLNN